MLLSLIKSCRNKYNIKHVTCKVVACYTFEVIVEKEKSGPFALIRARSCDEKHHNAAKIKPKGKIVEKPPNIDASALRSDSYPSGKEDNSR